MTIRKKLLVLTLVPVGLVLVLGATLFATFAEAGRSRRNALAAQEVVEGVFEQNVLCYEYLQHRSQRAHLQWQQKHASLRKLLWELDFQPADERESLAAARMVYQDIESLFAQLTPEQEDQQEDQQAGQQDGPKPDGPVFRRFQQRLASQLLAKSHALVSRLSRLTHASNARARAVERRTKLLVVALAAVVAILVAAASLRIGRGITRSIAGLREGTEVVGAGNLDHRIGYQAQDEIGALARSFDRMTQRLKEVTVSREALAEEVEAHKRTEEKLRRTMAELARSNADLDQFASVASHDLQEPLRIVSSYVQLLAKRYRGRLDTEADEFIEFAVDGARRMQQLIRDLLSYARVGTRGKPFAAVAADQAADEAIGNLGGMAARHEAEVSRDGLPTVTADRTQLVQLFQNLISNGIKFHADRPPKVHVSARRSDGGWTFSVRDNGVGIDGKYADRIFAMFQRLHTRQEYPGTGIGLAVCKRIVERHGGRIWFDSEPGQSTTFQFTIPDHKASRQDGAGGDESCD